MVRGAAIAGVVLFHFVWDLDFANLIPQGIATHPIWIAFGRLLAGTFMFLVGVSLVLAHKSGIRWMPFFKRIGVIALAAIAITIVTYLSNPDALIFYGILHAITIACLFGIAVVHWPVWVVLPAGLMIWILPLVYSSPMFDSRWVAWIGFAQSPPPSNDLVPIFPWLGISLIGIAIARAAMKLGLHERITADPPSGFSGRSLVFMGRHSLIIYLLHQPLLLAIILPMAK
jgi:uncharacterized membrane protein